MSWPLAQLRHAARLGVPFLERAMVEGQRPSNPQGTAPKRSGSDTGTAAGSHITEAAPQAETSADPALSAAKPPMVATPVEPLPPKAQRQPAAAVEAPLAEPVTPRLAPRGLFDTALVGGDTPPVDRSDKATNAARLVPLATAVAGCQKCPLHAQRHQTVFGEGDPAARLMFIGEGPGADEDATGRPFVGRAGQLLDKMIAAMTLHRHEVYIANVVKCRPPGNRVPAPEEIFACEGYLREQIAIIRPEVICALGATAARALLNTNEALGKMRGHWYDWRGIRLMVTYHPAYLLRVPADKAKAWDDLKKVMAQLGLSR